MKKGKPKSNRGGKRAGSGQKKRYNEPTTTFSCRVPVSRKSAISEVVHKILHDYRMQCAGIDQE